MRLKLVVMIWLFLCICSIASFSQNRSNNTNIPGRLVFKLKPQFRSLIVQNNSRDQKLLETLSEIGFTNLSKKFPAHFQNLATDNPEEVDISLIYQVVYNPELPFSKASTQLLNTGYFEYVEPLRSYSMLYEPNDVKADSNLLSTSSYQYHLKNIRAYRGWDFDKGDTSIVIGIIDTGIRTHEDLEGNIKFNYDDPIDGLDNDLDGYIDNYRGWDMADNDYNVNASDGHGTFVAGISSAKPDNTKGVAGVGFNCKFLPIKAYATTVAGSFAGYEAIVYAADHGCSVVNLSWGDPVPPSLYEQDLINYAVINKNVVVVAAAGNTNGKLDFYPASYNNVVSVGWLNKSNVKAATYSHKIDLSANGTNTWTTGFGTSATYTSSVSGSSFASPMVAGAAGLVRHKFPNYTAQQVAEQLRSTANPSIYTISSNVPYKDMLGKGILDVAKALTATNAKSVRYAAISQNNKGLFYAGDTIKLTASFKNYLSPVNNLVVTISTNSQYATVLQPMFQAGAVGTLATAKTTTPFIIKLASNVPKDEKIAFRFDYADGSYTDYQYYELYVNPDYLTLDVNKIAVTINSLGNFGYNGHNAEQGIGFRYKKINMLSEGGLMIGTSAFTVSDNVRNAAANQPADNNFLSQASILFNPYSAFADAEVYGTYTDKYPATGNTGVTVAYKAYAWSSAPSDKFAILEYSLKNTTTDTLRNLYAGLFADWDILNAGKNRALWDPSQNMGYVYNVKHDTIYAGIKLLTNGTPNYYAFNISSPPVGALNIKDGFSDLEKYLSLTNGTLLSSAGTGIFGGDVAQTVGSKLLNLAPNEETTIAFAVLAGDNLPDLQNTAEIAQANYDAGYSNSSLTPLPVTLLNFSASKNSEKTALLRWQTASETNNANFVIERSADGKHFEKIGITEGAGNSNSLVSYTFTDKNPLAGVNYYRLRQQDFDGKFSLSEIKTVAFTSGNVLSLTVHPNPFKEALEFNINLTASRNLELKLYDGLGRLVATPLPVTRLESGNHKIKYQAGKNLPAGIYTYKISGGNSVETGKVVLIK